MAITRVRMPTNQGRPVPVPVRYACDYGHVHPSFNQAVKCHERNRKRERGAGAR